MKKSFSFIILALGLFLYEITWAAEIKSVFQYEIAVESQQTRDRLSAIETGLDKILQRLTGNQKIMKMEAVATNFTNPSSFVEQFNYQRLPGENRLIITINYNKRAIKQILNSIGIPIWSEYRDPVLIWLILQDSMSNKVVNNYHQHAMLVRKSAEKQGISVLLPANADIANEYALPTDRSLSTLSARYNVKSSIMGSLISLEHKWRSKWTVVVNDKKFQVVVEGHTMENALDTTFEQINILMAQQFATFYDSAQSKNTISLHISGVNNPHDFFKIKTMLQNSHVINEFRVSQVIDDKITFELSSMRDVYVLENFFESKSQMNREYAQNGGLNYYWRSYQ